MSPSPSQLAILQALSSIEITAREISRALWSDPTKSQRQQVHNNLREMLINEWVAVDATAFPSRWTRTPLGIEAIQCDAVIKELTA